MGLTPIPEGQSDFVEAILESHCEDVTDRASLASQAVDSSNHNSALQVDFYFDLQSDTFPDWTCFSWDTYVGAVTISLSVKFDLLYLSSPCVCSFSKHQGPFDGMIPWCAGRPTIAVIACSSGACAAHSPDPG